MSVVEEMGVRAASAARGLAVATAEEKNAALEEMARALVARKAEILTANEDDRARGRENGISEALNGAGELFGLSRLRDQISLEASGMQILGRTILDNVRKFVGTQPQSDDMCLACVGRLP